ncbi:MULTISPECIES: tRNA lysidine(34) synthetase TilS [unclassified Ensifer]|uniref:tRNA lysidine(34) synthetase TilS n=1 Tax=unclassified Ensifer TaxID=2633371 RepID=UPI000813D3D1|nr:MULTISPECIES: tRNA lysidine(34) synthetase TilS [unclassified Ensifer]OCO97975.1 tRNA lysidine(34) synthetase TilS [Ensifer sp. LC11]OCO98640.1 tRNA lysidine(34) synthetase TilS [Ensifer sp. LC13]OCP04296.1 tRNA lysidine(34) synthetase TilS [Ensifer sp. LC14]OCP29288.1 tRNA lysidine(34) synthetase TilS [Ensifer sp. LC499]
MAVVETAKRFLSSFDRPARILVAVSGGSDSKGLLLALNEAIEASRPNEFSLTACTVDHALRSESAEEARGVAAFCESLSVPHIIATWDGPKPKTGIQAAAREARYRLLADAAEQFKACCIVTGHTRDDQRETVLMRSQRGAGPGIAGMAAATLYDRRFWVLRPFLTVDRASIRTFLTEQGMVWFDDPSNANLRFERVRARAWLASAPEVRTGVWDARSRARSSAAAAALLHRHVRVHAGLVAEISPVMADRCRDADEQRALLALASVIGGRAHLPAAETVDRLARFLEGTIPGRLTAGRTVFDRRASGLYLYREARGLTELTLAADESGIWDGRFLVRNTGNSPLFVRAEGGHGPQQQRLIAAGVPPGVAGRASLAAPQILSEDGKNVASATMEPRIGLYDTFLPGFDRIMADGIAGLFGRQRYLPPPVHDLLTEMER